MLSAFADQPLSLPPPGVKSNLTHPASRESQIYIAAGLCLPLILVFVSLRFYAKVAIMKNMRWDDCESHFPLHPALRLLMNHSDSWVVVSFVVGLVMTAYDHRVGES